VRLAHGIVSDTFRRRKQRRNVRIHQLRQGSGTLTESTVTTHAIVLLIKACAFQKIGFVRGHGRLILPGALHRGRKCGVKQITLYRKRTAISGHAQSPAFEKKETGPKKKANPNDNSKDEFDHENDELMQMITLPAEVYQMIICRRIRIATNCNRAQRTMSRHFA
jgi:hypothetical protein